MFGNGPESNVRYLENVSIGDGEAQVFDNTYLTFWFNYGLIGLASLLSLVAVLWWRLRSVAARTLMVGLAAQVFFSTCGSGSQRWPSSSLRWRSPGRTRPRRPGNQCRPGGSGQIRDGC
ncbi:hypothetical protein NKG94_27600 [Micromonospora sp. M12]